MKPAWVVTWALRLTGCCFLAVCASVQNEITKEPGLQGLSSTELPGPDWPWKKRAVTLVPSFTKTTTRHVTTHRPTTTHHTTTTQHNMTTHHPTTKHHPTTTHHNLTTHHTTTVNPNTTTHHPSTTHRPLTTHLPTRHATNQTTVPVNHTTTAPAPTQLPVVPIGDYEAGNKSAPCLRLQSGLQIQVHYRDQDERQRWGAFVLQPNHTKAFGNCSNQSAILDLIFSEGYLIFTFMKNETAKTFYLSRIQANLTYQFPQATKTTFGADNSSLRELEAHLGHSYQCGNRSLALTPDFHLHALQERVQAFELKTDQFGPAEFCQAPRRSAIVPIIVGVILGLLIVIVLVAYAVGRWRTQRGYQTI